MVFEVSKGARILTRPRARRRPRPRTTELRLTHSRAPSPGQHRIPNSVGDKFRQPCPAPEFVGLIRGRGRRRARGRGVHANSIGSGYLSLCHLARRLDHHPTLSPGSAFGSPLQVTSRREPRRFLLRSRLRPVETISATSSKASLSSFTTTESEDSFFDTNYRCQDRLLHSYCSVCAQKSDALEGSRI